MQIKLTPTHSNAWTLNNTAARASYVVSEIIYRNRGLPRAILDEKYTDMQASTFAFLRGTNHLFWDDLGTDALLSTFGNTAQTRTWLSGDCHLENFGAFTNNAGTALYDLNDFDASMIADYQLDVWRLALAMYVNMGQYSAISSSEGTACVDIMLDQYLASINTFASGNSEVSKIVTSPPTTKKYVGNLITESAAATTADLLTKYTTVTSGSRVFLGTDVMVDLAPTTLAEKTAIIASMPAYGASLSGPIAYSTSYFAVKDTAVRLHAGLGSLGLLRYYVLIEGPTSSNSDDVILDFKFQPEPAAFNNVHPDSIAATNNAAATSNKRAVWGYRSLSYLPDAYLGYTTVDGKLFSVRERNPHKKDIDAVDKYTSKSDHEYMATLWGPILAAAHARADVDSAGSGIAYSVDTAISSLVTGKNTQFKANVHSAIDGYVKQVQFDYAAFTATPATSIPEWTAAPTKQPTLAPTNQPTLAPTNQPTLAPTNQPTLAPTNQPTLAPTNQPTLAPTNQPTLAPTNQPTSAPTNQPTLAPTAAPNNLPTVEPTLAPTQQPTKPPTLTPTQPPTLIPTQQPTLTPTKPPTLAPTQQPNTDPITIVTQQPTLVPTAQPTPGIVLKSPTVAPTQASGSNIGASSQQIATACAMLVMLTM
ncbi:hypothetical protein BASA81_002139 [Batrachochytrium salamandrivorans]|nr:hypothetical protein BASA81_002139 [Batrachochytrium salamandrivorans]